MSASARHPGTMIVEKLDPGIASLTRATRSSPHAIAVRRAPLGEAELQKLLERIDVRGRDVRIGGEIRLGVEGGRRITPLFPADLVVVIERIDAGRRDVGVVREVAL